MPSMIWCFSISIFYGGDLIWDEHVVVFSYVGDLVLLRPRENYLHKKVREPGGPFLQQLCLHLVASPISSQQVWGLSSWDLAFGASLDSRQKVSPSYFTSLSFVRPSTPKTYKLQMRISDNESKVWTLKFNKQSVEFHKNIEIWKKTANYKTNW